jgi:hypothetical protein
MVGGGGGDGSENLIHRMAMEDPVPWWKKPNLRSMYLLLFPCVIGIEMTSGFDSQIINSAQLLPAWKSCKSSISLRRALNDCRSLCTEIRLQTLGIPRVRTAASSRRRFRSAPSSVCPSSRSSTTRSAAGGASCLAPSS